MTRARKHPRAMVAARDRRRADHRALRDLRDFLEDAVGGTEADQVSLATWNLEEAERELALGPIDPPRRASYFLNWGDDRSYWWAEALEPHMLPELGR